jgi:hypothetical protein
VPGPENASHRAVLYPRKDFLGKDSVQVEFETGDKAPRAELPDYCPRTRPTIEGYLRRQRARVRAAERMIALKHTIIKFENRLT